MAKTFKKQRTEDRMRNKYKRKPKGDNRNLKTVGSYVESTGNSVDDDPYNYLYK